jgi:two-component system, NtrC family, sensor kinase
VRGKLGLRLQILLLLGGLLLLAFAPLLLALGTYTQVTLRQVDDEHTRSLGGVALAYLSDALRLRSPDELARWLEREATPLGILAAAIDGADGTRVRFGSSEASEALERSRSEPPGKSIWLRAGEQHVLALAFEDDAGKVRLLLHASAASARSTTLIRMFGLYAFLIALALITLAYWALTHLIVRPLDQLAQAAYSVTLGSRQLVVPPMTARELGELGDSLQQMTSRLLNEEESLRRKISEVERATEELKKAQEQVVRSERLGSVGRLAAGLAHEVGNPIAALIGLLDLVIAGGLEPHEQQDFLRRMRSETERVNRTLKDLLQFARPSRDADLRETKPGDVEAAVHDTATLVLHQASMQGVELGIDIFPGLPPVTLGREQLVQVLLNLLLNAADALQGKGNVWVRARAGKDGIEILVEDDGPGIPADVAEHVFEPFFTTKEVGKGTGLGLSVCQALVAAAGGSLSLDREVSRGARFVVRLPLAFEKR